MHAQVKVACKLNVCISSVCGTGEALIPGVQGVQVNCTPDIIGQNSIPMVQQPNSQY